jgi:hypothetical protein
VKTKFIEVTNGPQNWGKFLVMRPEEEWEYKSVLQPDFRLLSHIGWAPNHIIVFDLQTCEGAAFRPGGYAKADLNKHRIWVCPMFEPFLEWLYKQEVSDLDALPAHVDLPDAEFQMSGYRRPGPGGETVHGLMEGRALCGYPGIPREWPPGHKWVDPRRDGSVMTCPKCIEVASKLP